MYTHLKCFQYLLQFCHDFGMLNKRFQQHFFNELTKIVSTLSLVCKTHVPIILPIKSFLTSAYLSKVSRQEHVFYDTYISCFKHYVQVNVAGKSRLSNLSLENQDYPICHWKIKTTQFVTGKSRLPNLSLENQDYQICHWKIKTTQFVTGKSRLPNLSLSTLK